MTTVSRRVGVFGGAFDPPHRAHVALVEAAVQTLQLDAVYVVPTGEAAHKAPAKTAAAHRLAMARLAFADVPQAIVDDCEVLRRGPSLMVDSLAALSEKDRNATKPQQTNVAWHLIIGLDQLSRFESWVQWQNIAAQCHLAVAYRGEAAGPALDPLALPLVINEWAGKGVRVTTVPFKPLAISSSAVRAAMQSAEGAIWQDWVPAQVTNYIATNQLYQDATP